jgi:hypothetical protein
MMHRQMRRPQSPSKLAPESSQSVDAKSRRRVTPAHTPRRVEYLFFIDADTRIAASGSRAW